MHHAGTLGFGKGDDDAELEKPKGISVDPEGNILIADHGCGDQSIFRTWAIARAWD